jgi:hypothetical protein
MERSSVSQAAATLAECEHCGKGIRRNRAGIWGARKHDDPHPWFCDASPVGDKRHEPKADR